MRGVQARALSEADVFAIERPHARLLTGYFLSSLLAGPLFPLVFLVRFVRFRTLRYRFDPSGISMSWGALFRREVHLTYARIQDIHLASNLVERYLGLARIQIQTASGTAGAEMTLEGLDDAAGVRDYLYSRMRGLRRAESLAGHDRVATFPILLNQLFRPHVPHRCLAGWGKWFRFRFRRPPPGCPPGCQALFSAAAAQGASRFSSFSSPFESVI